MATRYDAMNAAGKAQLAAIAKKKADAAAKTAAMNAQGAALLKAQANNTYNPPTPTPYVAPKLAAPPPAAYVPPKISNPTPTVAPKATSNRSGGSRGIVAPSVKNTQSSAVKNVVSAITGMSKRVEKPSNVVAPPVASAGSIIANQGKSLNQNGNHINERSGIGREFDVNKIRGNSLAGQMTEAIFDPAATAMRLTSGGKLGNSLGNSLKENNPSVNPYTSFDKGADVMSMLPGLAVAGAVSKVGKAAKATGAVGDVLDATKAVKAAKAAEKTAKAGGKLDSANAGARTVVETLADGSTRTTKYADVPPGVAKAIPAVPKVPKVAEAVADATKVVDDVAPVVEKTAPKVAETATKADEIADGINATSKADEIADAAAIKKGIKPSTVLKTVGGVAAAGMLFGDDIKNAVLGTSIDGDTANTEVAPMSIVDEFYGAAEPTGEIPMATTAMTSSAPTGGGGVSPQYSPSPSAPVGGSPGGGVTGGAIKYGTRPDGSVPSLYYYNENGEFVEGEAYIINGKTYLDAEGTVPAPEGTAVENPNFNPNDPNSGPEYWWKEDMEKAGIGVEGGQPAAQGLLADWYTENFGPMETEEDMANLGIMEQIMLPYQGIIDTENARIDGEVEAAIMQLREQLAARGIYNSDAAVGMEEQIRAAGESEKSAMYANIAAGAYEQWMSEKQADEEMQLQRDKMAQENSQFNSNLEYQKSSDQLDQDWRKKEYDLDVFKANKPSSSGGTSKTAESPQSIAAGISSYYMEAVANGTNVDNAVRMAITEAMGQGLDRNFATQIEQRVRSISYNPVQ